MPLEEEIRSQIAKAAEKMPSPERWAEVIVGSSEPGSMTYGTITEALVALLHQVAAVSEGVLAVAREVDLLRQE